MYKNGTEKYFKPTPLTVKEYQAGWEKVKERTSSSMRSGTHFGQWIAGYRDEKRATMHTILSNIPYMSGYSPKRWRYGTNAIIPKEKGNYIINRGS